MTKNAILALCTAAALAGCGGGSSTTTGTGDETNTTGTSGGENGGTTPTDADAGTAATDTGSGGETGGGDFAAKVAAGQDRFDHVCGTCHPEGSSDTGPDLHNKHFTVERMTNQIRNGSGHMRPIPVARLSDEDLPNVLAWLSTIGAVDGVAH